MTKTFNMAKNRKTKNQLSIFNCLEVDDKHDLLPSFTEPQVDELQTTWMVKSLSTSQSKQDVT